LLSLSEYPKEKSLHAFAFASELKTEENVN
jgi:hypothetical protein